MTHSRAIALLCGVLVLSSVAVATPTQSGTTAISGTQSTTASVVSPGHLPVSAERSDFASPGLSVTDSLSMSRATLDQHLSQATLRARLNGTSNDTERLQIVSNATDVLGNQTAALVADTTNARNRFRRGSLSGPAYVTKLASIDARASSLISLAQFIKNRPAADATVETRVAQFRARLLAYTNALDGNLTGAVRGQGNLGRVYVEAGPNGTALSTIANGTYTRTASRPTNYDANPGSVPSGGAVVAHVQQLYPWIMNQSAGVSFVPIPIQSVSAKYAYRLTLTYANGSVRSYVDMSTGKVYQETQTLSLNTFSTTPDDTARNGSARLLVSRTYPGGPLHVSVTANGEPTGATVTVANHTIGSTGRDGVVWALSPGGSFTVRATTENGTAIRVQSASTTA